MLKKFCCNAVCMDSTHKTNAYDFFLTTLLIIDDYGEGIPVGWMVSNKEEKLMIICFLQAIRKKSGVIHPHWFMSDDAEQYYSAWTYRVWYWWHQKSSVCMACGSSMAKRP